MIRGMSLHSAWDQAWTPFAPIAGWGQVTYQYWGGARGERGAFHITHVGVFRGMW